MLQVQVDRIDRKPLERRLHPVFKVDRGALHIDAAQLQRPVLLWRGVGRRSRRDRRHCRGWRHGCVERRRREQLRQVHGAIGQRPRLRLQARDRERADRHALLWHRHGDIRQFEAGHGDPVVLDSVRTQRETRQRDLRQLQVQRQLLAERHAIAALQVDGAGRDAKGERIAEEFPDTRRLQRGQRELALRVDLRRQAKAAFPVELLVGFAPGRQHERAALRGGPEIPEGEVDGCEHLGKTLAAREIDILQPPVAHRK